VKVLVTGATGFIGRNVLAPLKSLGYEVHAVYSSSYIENIQGVNWHQANLLDKNNISRLLAKMQPEYLLHLAWYAEPGKFWNSIENYRWLESSISLLLEFHRNGGQRVVMAGTCAEYDWKSGLCSEFTTPRIPATPYGICKNALQEILSSYSNQFALSSAWGRIFFMYGPGEHRKRLVASIVSSLLKNEPALCTHGTQIRDFLHVEDVANAFVNLLNSDVQGPVNIASGQPVAIHELIEVIGNQLGAKHLIHLGAIMAQQDEPPLLVGDNLRLVKEVGWVQRYKIETGIKETINWWKSQRKEDETLS